jgi:uncharacterized protein (TIGR01619 family)
MSQRWKSYFCHVNDRPASIFLDLEFRKTAPDKTRPWLLWVWVYSNQPRPDGLSSSEEFDTLSVIEDTVVTTMERKCSATFTGRITTDGRREFYFYALTRKDFDDAVRDATAPYNKYRFAFDAQLDPDWNQYLNVLYPSPEDLQRIQNRDVLEVLKQRGDTLETPRDILHWAYFKNKEDRENFRNAVQFLGFRVESIPKDVAGEYAHGICVAKKQEMAHEAVDATVIALHRASETSGGKYDGWECELIANKKASDKKPWWKF